LATENQLIYRFNTQIQVK